MLAGPATHTRSTGITPGEASRHIAILRHTPDESDDALDNIATQHRGSTTTCKSFLCSHNWCKHLFAEGNSWAVLLCHLQASEEQDATRTSLNRALKEQRTARVQMSWNQAPVAHNL